MGNMVVLYAKSISRHPPHNCGCEIAPNKLDVVDFYVQCFVLLPAQFRNGQDLDDWQGKHKEGVVLECRTTSRCSSECNARCEPQPGHGEVHVRTAHFSS